MTTSVKKLAIFIANHNKKLVKEGANNPDLVLFSYPARACEIRQSASENISSYSLCLDEQLAGLEQPYSEKIRELGIDFSFNRLPQVLIDAVNEGEIQGEKYSKSKTHHLEYTHHIQGIEINTFASLINNEEERAVFLDAFEAKKPVHVTQTGKKHKV